MADDKADGWMPLYIGDYKKDTSHLTTELHGAYLLMLMSYWTTGPLPDDDDDLSVITGLGKKGWKAARPKLAKFFKISDGIWRNKRADEEMEKWASRKAQAIERARKGGFARSASSRNKAASSTQQAVLEQCSTSTSTSSVDVSSKKDTSHGRRRSAAEARREGASAMPATREEYWAEVTARLEKERLSNGQCDSVHPQTVQSSGCDGEGVAVAGASDDGGSGVLPRVRVLS